MTDKFAPKCMKCGSRHYFSEACVVVSLKPDYCEVTDNVFECSECVLKDRRILQLEAKLEKGLKKRRIYQKAYMRKRRAK